MGSRYLTDLAEVCRRTGWPVIEVDGWPQRARGSGGYDGGRPNHVMIHHTASGPASDGWPDVNYCTFGDEDAPLCNLYLARDGTIYVCAAGATNTNGSGSDPCYVTADDSMNSSAIGIEAGNGGTGEPWPADQQLAYADLCDALCDAYGIGIAQIHAHAEWTPRKVDPAGPSDYAEGADTWDMDAFRADVDETQPEPEPEPIPLPEEDAVPFIIRNRDSGQIVLLAYDGAGVTATGLAAEDLDAYQARFGTWLDTNPTVFDDLIRKSNE